MSVQVIKFGGVILDKKTTFEKIPEILSATKMPIVIIVSAIAKTTRELEAAANIAEKGNKQKADNKLDEIKKLHFRLINDIFPSEIAKESVRRIGEIFVRASRYIEGISATEELTKKSLDKVLAIGEEISATIFFNYLIYKNFKATLIHSNEVIETDTNYGNASPNLAKCRENINTNIQTEFNEFDIIVTEGFSGISYDGNITTMGMESSNLTATILASFLGSKEVTICTDVDGLKSADPKLINGVKDIPFLSYKQASTAAKNGLKLLYPKMISLLKESAGKIKYQSIENANSSITEISNGGESEIPVIIVRKLHKINVTDFSLEDKIKLVAYLDLKLNDNLSKYTLCKGVLDIQTDKDLCLNKVISSSKIKFDFDLLKITILFASKYHIALLNRIESTFNHSKKYKQFSKKYKQSISISDNKLEIIVPMEYGLELAQFVHDSLFEELS